MIRGSTEWKEIYTRMGALWIHSGNPSEPHALLTSGLHSNGYFNSKPVTENSDRLLDAAGDLLDKLTNFQWRYLEIERVIGPQTGATKLAKMLAAHIPRCKWASPEKVTVGGVQKMVFYGHRKQKVVRGERVMLCEDVVSTGESLELTAAIVRKLGGKILPYEVALVNRSASSSIDGRQIVSLIHHEMPMWKKEECPLCKQGSEPLRPREGNNWEFLTASYT